MRILLQPFTAKLQPSAAFLPPAQKAGLLALVRGFRLELARMAGTWPDVEVSEPLREGQSEDEESEDSEQASLDNMMEGAQGNQARDGILHDEADATLSAEVSVEAHALEFRGELLDTASGVVLAEIVASGTLNGLPSLLALVLKPLAAHVVREPVEVDTAPASLDAEALRHLLLGLDARDAACLFEEEDAIERAYGHWVHALQQDSDIDAVVELMEDLTDQLVSREDLQLEPARRALLWMLDEGRETPLLLRQLGLLELRSDRVVESAGYFRRALDAGDSREVCSYLLARCAEVRGEWSEMDGWARMLLQEEPGDALYQFVAGVSANHTGEPERAAECWRESLRLDPEADGARACLARLLWEQGRADEALSELEPVLTPADGGPPDWQFLEIAAPVLRESGQTERAIALIDEHLAAEPRDAEEMLDAAELLETFEDHERARSLYGQILTLEPESEEADVAGRLLSESLEPGFEVAFRRAADAILEDKGPEHLVHLQRWAQVFPYSWHVLYLLGNAAWQANDMDLATGSFQRAHAIRAQHPEILSRWGVVLLEAGRMDEAEMRLRQAIAIGTGDPQPYLNLALVLAYRRNFREALAQLRKAAGFEPDPDALLEVKKAVLLIWRDRQCPLPKGGRLPVLEELRETAATAKVTSSTADVAIQEVSTPRVIAPVAVVPPVAAPIAEPPATAPVPVGARAQEQLAGKPIAKQSAGGDKFDWAAFLRRLFRRG